MIETVSLRDFFERTLAGIKEHFERIITEHDHRYEDRFKAQELAVKDAFLASEKASGKAEEAQRQHNELSNGLQRKMDERDKEFIARPEFAQRLDRIDKDLVEFREFKASQGTREVVKGEGVAQDNSDRSYRLVITIAVVGQAITVISGIIYFLIRAGSQ